MTAGGKATLSPKTKRLGLALLASIVAIGLLLGVSDISGQSAAEGVIAMAKALSPGWVALTFAAYALSYVGRAARLSLLLPGQLPLLRLFSISARHNLFNLVLPLRSGEASLPLMLRNECGRPLAEGTAALVVARVLDLTSVCLFLLLGLALSGLGGDELRPPVLGLLVALLAVACALRPVALWLSKRLPTDKGRVANFAASTATHLAAQPSGRLLASLAVSLLTWLLTYCACWLLVVDMAHGDGSTVSSLAQVTFVTSLVASTCLHLVGILPINTMAGVGPWEAGWVAGYVFIGVTQEAAFASAVVSHGVIFSMVSLLGGLGLVLRGPQQAEREIAATPE
ncbi:MAG: uncharacterized membrane protein YbhN (UPF0104 family) [Pseudohongiellaceae bacterium]|jgi:uncharacterized membrane protein YbhN (UPF0104 family)